MSDQEQQTKPDGGASVSTSMLERGTQTDFDHKEDSRIFGEEAWVYCSQHMRPHRTGWCTVSPRNKTALEAKTLEAAYAECRERGFDLYDDMTRSNA